ncbi:hypothetical protein [Brevibacterium marinum]|uniref:Uncharacterized protein n=1 Tax=Brevibacterium marinum TaxID=418643 RepID=A0A846S997_9MICO|nr:hypothetical protein [Brevibacterium marinum]NJC57377.1 hypothetical protein [Brevibacterium marinum]
MMWQFQATVSDHIHRLTGGQGETLWGVVHDGFDADHPEALGEVDVDLPSGRRSLLLVRPFPGGLILDSVRSYQGLMEGELTTLFLGIFDELLNSSDAASRLCLDGIGLTADGRPRLIPGIRRRLASSTRSALGEMMYHAAHGRPWAESLLPVDLALPQCSRPLRSLVAQLLDDTDDDSPLQTTVAEVSVSLRATGAPNVLPLLPAERDLDPGQALTARLRAADPGATGKRGPGEGPGTQAEPGTPVGLEKHANAEAGSKPGERSGEPSRLREASRRGARRHRSRDAAREPGISRAVTMARALGARGRDLLHRHSSSKGRPRKSMTGLRVGVLVAVCLTLLGGAVMVRAWSSEPAASVDTEQRSQVAMTDEEAVALLEDLCQRRSAALSDGDGQELKKLTVPDSSAAAADELLDLRSFVGIEYSIHVDEAKVRELTDRRILIDAQMSRSATVGGEESQFAPKSVQFELGRDAAAWKILEVTEIDG